MFGEQVLHHVRRLGAVIDGHALLAFVPVGDDRASARLVTPVWRPNTESRLNNRIGFGEGLVDGSDVELPFEAEIVAKRGMDHRRFGIESNFGIGDRRQFLVTYLDQLAGILGLGARSRDHGANRFALPARAFDRDEEPAAPI
mgnify:CR=1 FL=1